MYRSSIHSDDEPITDGFSLLLCVYVHLVQAQYIAVSTFRVVVKITSTHKKKKNFDKNTRSIWLLRMF